MDTPILDWTSLNGKEIEAVYWPDTDTEKGRMWKYDVDTDTRIVLNAEYMGDRTEVWVVILHRGVETFRHNARMVETIAWKDE